jgi:hypothetical protein
MAKNNLMQAGIALATLAFLALLTDPFMLFMPPMLGMAVLLAATVLLVAFAGLVLNERAADEREDAHRQTAGRAAYLSGIATLTLALFVQGLSHHIDPWIAAALAAMVVAKLAARWYAGKYK